MLKFIILTMVMVAVIVSFTSLTDEENDKAAQTGIRPYSWNEFLQMVNFSFPLLGHYVTSYL